MKTIAGGAKVWNTNTSTVILTHILTHTSMNTIMSMNMNSTLLFLLEGSLSKKPAMGLPVCPYPDFLLVQSDLTNLTSITMQVDLKTK